MHELVPVTTPKTYQVPLIPVRDVVIYPTNEVVLTFGRKKSQAAVNAALGRDKLVALFTQRQSGVDDPTFADIYPVGTLCQVERTLKTDGELNALVRGIARIRLLKEVESDPIQVVEVVELVESSVLTPELEALARHLTTQFRAAVNLGKSVEFMNFMRLMSGVSASELADQVSPTLNLPLSDHAALLANLDLQSRLYQINDFLTKEIKVLEIEKSIASKTQEKFSKSMKETVLRERLNTIKAELGETDDVDQELNELEDDLLKLKLPKKARAKVSKEFDRLDRMSPNNPESSYLRTWLETVAELPWGKLTPDRVALATAEKVLNDDHYGLEEVKERILEYLSVLKLKKAKHSDSILPTILCFVGPPGVGKTSLGKSIARSLKRRFVKVSLGGIRDEAEIRGHRKSYIGAMPGRIIEGI